MRHVDDFWRRLKGPHRYHLRGIRFSLGLLRGLRHSLRLNVTVEAGHAVDRLAAALHFELADLALRVTARAINLLCSPECLRLWRREPMTRLGHIL